jgi:ankyrin repeat protein
MSAPIASPDLNISALDCAYLKGFFAVYKPLFEQDASTADHPTINQVLTIANLGIRALSTYLESNHGWAASFTFALHIAVLYHQPHLDDAIDVLLACGLSPNTYYLPYPAAKSTLAYAIPNIDLVGRLLGAGARINHHSVITAASSNPDHFECLVFLIAQGMDLAEVGSVGLSVAVENGNEKAFKLLLRAGADANRKPNPTPDRWIPPLSVAARKGNHEAARALLYGGANVDIEDERNRRPIHYAARLADLRMVTLLVRFGADLGDPEDADVNKWYISVMESCALRTLPYNSQDPYYSQDPSSFGDVTHRLWSNEDTEIIKYLVEMGAGLNSAYVGDSDTLRRNSLVTNLILSSADNSVVRFTLRMGARFDGKFDSYHTISATITPLQAAARKANLEMVKELHARGADVNAEPSEYSGTTALQAACDGKYDAENRLAVVEYLLDHGADVNGATAYESKNAICAAASRGYVEITVRLLNCGADVRASGIFAARTPLYYAARDGRLDAVQLLLNNNTCAQRPEQSDYKEEIMVAEKSGHWAMADLLRRYEQQSESESE